MEDLKHIKLPTERCKEYCVMIRKTSLARFWLFFSLYKAARYKVEKDLLSLSKKSLRLSQKTTFRRQKASPFQTTSMAQRMTKLEKIIVLCLCLKDLVLRTKK